jgi:hypothetical protein
MSVVTKEVSIEHYAWQKNGKSGMRIPVDMKGPVSGPNEQLRNVALQDLQVVLIQRELLSLLKALVVEKSTG